MPVTTRIRRRLPASLYTRCGAEAPDALSDNAVCAQAQRKALAAKKEHEVQYAVEVLEGEMHEQTLEREQRHTKEIGALRAELHSARDQLNEFEEAVRVESTQLLEQL